MGLPAARVGGLLQRAMASVPLVADDEPLDVVFEDDDFLAVGWLGIGVVAQLGKRHGRVRTAGGRGGG